MRSCVGFGCLRDGGKSGRKRDVGNGDDGNDDGSEDDDADAADD